MPEHIQNERLRAKELLPWYVNGGLDDNDSHWLRDWLQAHPEEADIHAELAWLKQSSAQYKSSIELPEPDRGLDALLARIQAEKSSVVQAQRSSASKDTVDIWAKVKSWFAMPAFGLSMAALLLVQTGVIGLLVNKSPVATQGTSTQEQTITPLSGSQIAVPANAAFLQVTFVPTATEADMREILGKAQAQIVSGPSSLGVYVISVPAVDAEKSLQLLLKQKQVIESAGRP